MLQRTPTRRGLRPSSGLHRMCGPVHAPRIRRRAAEADAGDPYEVLGVPRDASSDKVAKAYRTRKREAEAARDMEMLTRLEKANDTIMMATLSRRITGEGPVDKQIKNADRTRLLPWLPRVWRAEDLIIKVAIGAFAAFAALELLLKPAPDGTVNACIVGAVLNTWKQYSINPAGAGDMQSGLDTGYKNVLRGALLAILATGAAVVLFWTLPNALADATNFLLPLAYVERQGFVLTVVSILANAATTVWLR